MAGRNPWLCLPVVCLGAFAILLDTTIVNVAIPSILTDLQASFDQAVWVINAYLLAFAALLIAGGRLGDMFGPRRLFIVGLTVFAVSSALCGAAHSPEQLIAARAVQGAGAAALAPQGLVLIRALFPRERMGAAIGVFSGMIGLAAVCGPTLGGLLTTYLSWRWVFYVNLPVSVVAIAGALLFVPDIRTGRQHRLDPVGVVLAALGLTAVTYGLIEGQRYAWGTIAAGITIPEVIGAGAVLLAVFGVWEKFQREPLVPLGLLRARTFAIMIGLSVAVQFALQSQLLVTSINLQSVLGMTPVRAGLTSLPLTLALVTVAPFAGRLTDRFGGKYTLICGLTVYGIGIAGVAMAASLHATSLTFAPPLLVAGLGMGAIFAPISTEAMRAAPAGLAGAASGLLNTSRQIGATLGSAVTGAVLESRLTAAMHGRAAAVAVRLPVPARARFLAGFSHPASDGLELGRGESGVPPPRNISLEFAARIRDLTTDVFRHAYITAMHTALAVPVTVLLAGAAACLLLARRAPGPSATRPSPPQD